MLHSDRDTWHFLAMVLCVLGPVMPAIRQNRCSHDRWDDTGFQQAQYAEPSSAMTFNFRSGNCGNGTGIGFGPGFELANERRQVDSNCSVGDPSAMVAANGMIGVPLTVLSEAGFSDMSTVACRDDTGLFAIGDTCRSHAVSTAEEGAVRHCSVQTSPMQLDAGRSSSVVCSGAAVGRCAVSCSTTVVACHTVTPSNTARTFPPTPPSSIRFAEDGSFFAPSFAACSPVSPEPEAAGILKRISCSSLGNGSTWADVASHSVRPAGEDDFCSTTRPSEGRHLPSVVSERPVVRLQRLLYLDHTRSEGRCVDSDEHPAISTEPYPLVDNTGTSGDLTSNSRERRSSEHSPDPNRKPLVFGSGITCSAGLCVPLFVSNYAGNLGHNTEACRCTSVPTTPLCSAVRGDALRRGLSKEAHRCRQLSPLPQSKGKHVRLDTLHDELLLTVMEDIGCDQALTVLPSAQRSDFGHQVGASCCTFFFTFVLCRRGLTFGFLFPIVVFSITSHAIGYHYVVVCVVPLHFLL